MAVRGVLPKKNDRGYYDIRMESIGGMGANLAGKILAEAGVLGMDWNGVSFASYGSEKKGTPVTAYVRFCEPSHELRDGSPVEEPNLLVVFHENVAVTQPVLQGIKENAIVIVNTPGTPDEVRDRIRLHAGTLYCVDASKIAVEEKVRINTTLLGTVVRAMDFMDKESLKDAIRKTFQHKYPKLVEGNLRAFDRGYEEAQIKTFPPDGKYPYIPYHRFEPKFGYLTAPLGGVLQTPGSTVEKDLSVSREGFIPVLDKEKCVNCAECDSTCPDQCFVWVRHIDEDGKEKQFLDHIDYMHCKGCLRCILVCKPGALTAERETADLKV